jgi:hypothetical protein
MWASIKKSVDMNDHRLPQMDFDMGELRAILSILRADLKQSRRTMGLLSKQQQEKEKKRITLINRVRQTLEGQIQANDVHFILTLEELKAIIKSLKIYRNFVSTMFPRNADRDRVLAITHTWLTRFNTLLSSLQSL